MAKLKKTDFKTARDRINALPDDRRASALAGADKIIQQMHLSELRKGAGSGQLGHLQKNSPFFSETAADVRLRRTTYFALSSSPRSKHMG
jgi:hypothetical protein